MLKLSDINLVVTTDMHSWIEARKHEPHLNASIADLETMVGALRALASAQGKDVFLFDNGDINDGTGLSAAATNHVEKNLVERNHADARTRTRNRGSVTTGTTETIADQQMGTNKETLNTNRPSAGDRAQLATEDHGGTSYKQR